MKAKLAKLIAKFGNAKKIAKIHGQKCTEIINSVWEDSRTDDENEAKCNEALYRAGLTDENGNTSVYEKERMARAELLDYIFSILPKKEQEILKNNRNNIVQMDRVIELARKFAA